MLVAAGVRRRRGGRIGVDVAARARGGKAREVLLPQRIVAHTEIVEVVPGENTRIVAVGDARLIRGELAPFGPIDDTAA